MQFNQENYYDKEEMEQYNIYAPSTSVSQKYKDDEYSYMDDDNTDTTTDSEVLIPAQHTVENVFINSATDVFEVHIGVKKLAQKNIRINTDKYHLYVSISPKVGEKGLASFSHSFRLPKNANTRNVATKYIKGFLVVSVQLKAAQF